MYRDTYRIVNDIPWYVSYHKAVYRCISSRVGGVLRFPPPPFGKPCLCKIKIGAECLNILEWIVIYIIANDLIVHVQTLKCTTTPENRSVQTVQHFVHRSNRSMQTIQHSVYHSNRSVQTVQRSVHHYGGNFFWKVLVKLI